MFSKTSEFTLADNSSKPFAWMIEGTDYSEIRSMGVEKYVREYAKTSINATNYTGAKDSTVYKVWRSGSEFQQAVNFIKDAIS